MDTKHTDEILELIRVAKAKYSIDKVYVHPNLIETNLKIVTPIDTEKINKETDQEKPNK
jgi:hypothetical protein